MEVTFTAAESLEIVVAEQTIPIQHYLRQPQRLVQAIVETSLTEQLSENQFRLKMRPLNFLDMYYFQPTVILNVWATSGGRYFCNHKTVRSKVLIISTIALASMFKANSLLWKKIIKPI